MKIRRFQLRVVLHVDVETPDDFSVPYYKDLLEELDELRKEVTEHMSNELRYGEGIDFIGEINHPIMKRVRGFEFGGDCRSLNKNVHCRKNPRDYIEEED